MVDSILRSIAGRENEPATSVFKNVTAIKGATAAGLLKLMDEQYGRGLGWTCNNCHVIGKFDDDSRKNKKIARQMQQMQDHINADRLTLVKELDDNYNKASCAMCHRGESHAWGELEVLAAPPPQRRPAGAPPAGQGRPSGR
ncbi:MAG: photosynthetic reaction center cytochrome c subunit [Gemmatimonadetes bacterium]|nr:photosynthetic reaction center cytochrome c subunit [Gemmatimonadota bacterium]